MAYGIVRLTLYGLLSAVESDLRRAITTELLVNKSPKDFLAPATYQRAAERMAREDENLLIEPDSKMVEYLDFAECIEVLSASRELLTGAIRKAVIKLAQNASELVPIRNRVMHSRPLEYDDFARVTSLCKELLSFPAVLFPSLRQVEQLIKNDPTYVLSLRLDDLDSRKVRCLDERSLSAA